MEEITKAVNDFADKLWAIFVNRTNERLSDVMRIGMINDPSAAEARRTAKSPGHNPSRRKGPIQLCPVPGCKKRAAPVFGMVCAGHKDVPKREIKKYRENRRRARAK